MEWIGWSWVEGYEGMYSVSTTGVVKSCERFTIDGKHLMPKEIKGGCYPNGYRFVCLRKDGVNKNHMIHRLVAQAFIPNPYDLPEVNHKDGNKQNNRIENLEWCTRSENLNHAVQIGLIESQCKIRRKVTIQNDQGTVTFSSMLECEKFFGFKKGWLQPKIRKHGLCFSYGGYQITIGERG